MPILMGAICGFEVNRRADRGIRTTLALAAGAGLATAAAFLLFGLEGAICIIMVVPIGAVTILMGALIGRQIALQSSDRLHAFTMVALLPLVASIERAMPTPPLHHVVTTIDIAATPEQVFDEVVSFSEITAERPWYFRTGIAVPLRARIEGTGVGAVRHCEFTTGPFVEPITAWERGQRLAFDVRSSPPPMEEWSPYRHLHPPHLDSTMRSRRGEFRMHGLPGGRTRLEGHTYYELGLRPDAYFAWIADALVHRIHARVLEHVARSVEAKVQAR
ncbi:MAG: SRPBCC family protein [Polyangiaceae bacterium]|nr:SRPBCC family protein [Polyangiaceae bacterium]